MADVPERPEKPTLMATSMRPQPKSTSTRYGPMVAADAAPATK